MVIVTVFASQNSPNASVIPTSQRWIANSDRPVRAGQQRDTSTKDEQSRAPTSADPTHPPAHDSSTSTNQQPDPEMSRTPPVASFSAAGHTFAPPDRDPTSPTNSPYQRAADWSMKYVRQAYATDAGVPAAPCSPATSRTYAPSPPTPTQSTSTEPDIQPGETPRHHNDQRHHRSGCTPATRLSMS